MKTVRISNYDEAKVAVYVDPQLRPDRFEMTREAYRHILADPRAARDHWQELAGYLNNKTQTLFNIPFDIVKE